METLLSDREEQYLTTKRILLSNPGFKLSDAYYSKFNTQVDLAEITWNYGRFTNTLSNSNFGSNTQIIIPNSSLLSTCYLHLELPPIIAEQTICRGWGYACIDTISYLFGSSNVSQIQIDGQSLFQLVMTQADTQEKRSELIRLGGQEFLIPSIGDISSDIILPLPWSTSCGLNSKLPVDTNIIKNPITIQIRFKAATSIYGGTGVRPNGFQNTLVTLKQGDFTNKGDSLALELRQNPDSMYGYPFIHSQSFVPTDVLTDANGRGSIVLQSFINADLVGMMVGVVKASDLSPISTESKNPFNYAILRNVRLTFNGLVMYSAVGEAYRLFQTDTALGAGNWQGSLIDPGVAAPFSSQPVDNYLLIMDFTRKRSICYEGHYANTWRIGQNTMLLNFEAEAATSYRIQATYLYNGIAEITQGETRIFFD